MKTEHKTLSDRRTSWLRHYPAPPARKERVDLITALYGAALVGLWIGVIVLAVKAI